MSVEQKPLEGRRVLLRRLQAQDINERYLAWLNDPEVVKYSRRQGTRSTMRDLQQFYEASLTSSDLIFAICLQGSHKHIGNISLNNIQLQNRSAEISIMIGDRSEWGRGAGTEAIELLTRYAFCERDLHRVWAESPNPGFNKSVARLGWTKEGLKREAFCLDGKMLDFECYSLLRPDWERQKK